MSDFAPKDLPSRKSKVHKRSRERIVETERQVLDERRATASALGEARAHARRADAWQDAFKGPLESGFIDSLYRQVGAMMADMLMEQIQEDENGAIKTFGMERMQRAAREIGDKAAGNFIEHFLAEKMEIKGNATRMMEEDSVRVLSSVRFEPTDIHYAHKFDMRENMLR